MRARTPLVLVAAVAAVVGLAGCGGDDDADDAAERDQAEQAEQEQTGQEPDEGDDTTLRAIDHDRVDGDVAELLPDDVAFPEGTSVVFSEPIEGDYSVSGQYEIDADVDDIADFYRAHFDDLGWDMVEEREVDTEGDRGWQFRFESDEHYEDENGYDVIRYEVVVTLQEAPAANFAQITWSDRKTRSEYLAQQ